MTRSAAIVGVAESDLGRVADGLTALDLIGQATTRALDDAGMSKSEIDGVFCHSAFFGQPTSTVSQYLGIHPRYQESTATGGSSFVAQLGHAVDAVEAGRCQTALITYGSTQRSSAGGLVPSAGEGTRSYEAPARPRMPVSAYALAAARHMAEYGTTREQLAQVAVSARDWARMNPRAFERGDLTIDDVVSSRMVSSPLTVRDCCLVTDGGGAVIVTALDRARDLPSSPVHLLGLGEATWHQDISQMPDLTTTAAKESGSRAFEAAGLTPQDMDFAQVYDAFTINTILFLEDLGFCAKGDGGAYVAEGRIGPGGSFPVNTNGGGLSYCHPGMYGIFLIIEAVRQLRGQSGPRQVRDAHLGVIHGNGGTLSSQVTAVLGDDTTVPR